MRITFWGTRGAIPVPGMETTKYGGETPCVEVDLSGGTILILDAGTGLRRLGLSLLERGKPVRTTILVSHFHLDHILGFPYFAPLWRADSEIEFIGRPSERKSVQDAFNDLLRPPYSSLTLDHFPAKLALRDLKEEPFNIGSARIETIRTNHEGLCYGFRISEGNCTVVYLTDNEAAPPSPGPTTFEALARFAREADLLIHDAWHSDEEYENKCGIGHSSFSSAVRLALNARVKSLAFFHYNIAHTDDFLDAQIDKQIALLRDRGEKLRVFGAWEGAVWLFTG